jgi:hypothetical protein
MAAGDGGLAVPPNTPPIPPPGLEPKFAADHPRILLRGATLEHLKAAAAAKEPAYTKFQAMVDRQLKGGDSYGFKAHFAALVARITGDEKYCDFAVANADAQVIAEERLIAAGAEPRIQRDNFLYVGQTVGDVIQTYDWCFPRTTDDQRKRWLAYANQAVFNVWNNQKASWGGKARPWSGWSVNNPSNNYYYSFLTATMLLGIAARGEIPDAEGWIKMFRETKIRDQLVPTFQKDLVGGGSLEGPAYGIAMRELFHLYDVWEASTGERIATLTGHAKDSMAYLLHVTLPTLDRIAPIGDQPSTSNAPLVDYHRQYLLELMWLFRNDPLARVGQTYLRTCSVPEMKWEFTLIYELLYKMPTLPESPLDQLSPTYYAPGTGHVFMRSGWSKADTWVNFIAGTYSESHAHRDQGSFMIYKNEWLAVDEVILTKSGIRQDEWLHNLVRIVSQGKTIPMTYRTSAKMLAVADGPELAYVAADMTPNYMGKASVSKVEREMVFLKPDVVVVFDRVETTGDAQKVWHLSTPLAPVATSSGVLIQGARSRLSVEPVLPAGRQPSIVSWPSQEPDTTGGSRIDIPEAAPGLSHFLVVLSIDDAVTRRQATTTAGSKGVTLTLKDGRVVTLQFRDNTPGGSVEIVSAPGQAPKQIALAPGIVPPPLLRQ